MKNDLINKEQFWMDYYQSYDREFGYNISPRADRTIISEETRKKQSKYRKGRKRPEATGWHHNKNAKKKIGEVQKEIRKGIKLSKETKKEDW